MPCFAWYGLFPPTIHLSPSSPLTHISSPVCEMSLILGTTPSLRFQIRTPSRSTELVRGKRADQSTEKHSLLTEPKSMLRARRALVDGARVWWAIVETQECERSTGRREEKGTRNRGRQGACSHQAPRCNTDGRTEHSVLSSGTEGSRCPSCVAAAPAISSRFHAVRCVLCQSEPIRGREKENTSIDVPGDGGCMVFLGAVKYDINPCIAHPVIEH